MAKKKAKKKKTPLGGIRLPLPPKPGSAHKSEKDYDRKKARTELRKKLQEES